MAEQIHTEVDVDEDSDSDEEEGTLEWGEVKWVGVFGLIAGYFVLSGSIATFLYLDWVGLAPMLANALEPLGPAAAGILGVVALFINFVIMSLLVWNAQFVKVWLEENTAF